MAKKDFSNSSKAIDLVNAAITDTKADKKEPAGRVNLVFTDPELFKFTTIMAKSTGNTMTSFIIKVLQEYMDAHAESYKLALQLQKSLEEGR